MLPVVFQLRSGYPGPLRHSRNGRSTQLTTIPSVVSSLLSLQPRSVIIAFNVLESMHSLVSACRLITSFLLHDFRSMAPCHPFIPVQSFPVEHCRTTWWKWLAARSDFPSPMADHQSFRCPKASALSPPPAGGDCRVIKIPRPMGLIPHHGWAAAGISRSATGSVRAASGRQPAAGWQGGRVAGGGIRQRRGGWP